MDNSYHREQDVLFSELAQLEKQAKQKEIAERAENAKAQARELGLERDVIMFQIYTEGKERDIEALERKIEEAKKSKKPISK